MGKWRNQFKNFHSDPGEGATMSYPLYLFNFGVILMDEKSYSIVFAIYLFMRLDIFPNGFCLYIFSFGNINSSYLYKAFQNTYFTGYPHFTDEKTEAQSELK